MSGRRVKIGTVWDRAVDVLQGRTGMLFVLALGLMIVPTLIGNVIALLAGASPAGRGLVGLVSIAASLLMIVGLLAITAVASDPQVDARDATASGLVRLGPAVGLLLIVALVATLVVTPIAATVFYSGASYNPTTGAINISRASGSGIALAGLLALVGAVAGLWISAKLVPLFAVIVNERLGMGALRRSFALTRGAALRLIGVLILFGIVSIVAVSAATSVTGVVARLVLGGEAAASVALIVATVNSFVTALLSVVQMVFSAQYYVAARDADAVAAAE